MIGKIKRGKAFRPLANYLFKGGRGEIVAGTMAGRTPRELAAEFARFRRLNPKLVRAVVHFSLSLSPKDPPMTTDTWKAIAEFFMAEMGWGADTGAPWCAIVHRDTDHQHLHFVACRIDQNGRTIPDSNDFRRAEAAIRRIEQIFGLTVVASPKTKKARLARAVAARPAETTTTPQEEHAMTDPAAQHNPFNPGSPHSATWPQPFEPGRDLAEVAMADLRGLTVPSASVADPLGDKRRRNLRRCTAEERYSEALLTLFGAELAHVFKHGRGAVLYFSRPEEGRLSDQGDKITALAGMSEAAAARRIVALATAPGRGWKSITFTGSALFVELAMREALAHRLTVYAKGAEQAAILARLMAEKQGAMGAMAGPGSANAPAEPILAPLAELDGLELDRPRQLAPLQPPETSPKTPKGLAPEAPPPAPQPIPAPLPATPTAPVIGVAPMFRNLRERLQNSRKPQGSAPEKRPGTPSALTTRPGQLGRGL
jgi:hypothetical protein